MNSQASHISELWATLIIEELVRLGLSSICIAPGSRSTPLTIAAAQHPSLRCHTHFDERGLGFFALGLAKQSQQAVAILTTSGTAVANLLPAIVEAKQSAIKLMVLSADRPLELINVGANQAIDQQGIFSNFVVADDYLPAASLSLAAEQLLLRIDRIWTQMQDQQGPIQLNCPFREPLYPSEQKTDFSQYLLSLKIWLSSKQTWTQPTVKPTQKTRLQELNVQKTVVIIGRQLDSKYSQAIAQWAQQQQLPVLSDIQAQLIHSNYVLHPSDSLAKFAGKQLDAQRILQFGTQLVGKSLGLWIEQQVHNGAHWWLIEDSPCPYNPAQLIQERIATLCLDNSVIKGSSDYFKAWQDHQTQVLKRCDHYFESSPDSELHLAKRLCQELDMVEQLFIGNSLSIRLFDRFARANKALSVMANRGASGIDGLLATAIGMHAAHSSNSLVVLGDTSALYDLNSMAMWQSLTATMVVVVINNDGGEIFAMLDGCPDPEIQQQFYQMPHGLNFECAAKVFNINYQRCKSTTSVISEAAQAFAQQRHLLIEFSVSAGQASYELKRLNQMLKPLDSSD